MLLRILTAIEQSADLVHPSLTRVALYPAFLVHFVIFLLLEIPLGDSHIDELDRNLVVQLVETSTAPKVLVVAPNIEMTIAADALILAIHAVAKVNRRLEQEFLASAEGAGPLVLPPLKIFGFQLRHELRSIALELYSEFLGHVVHYRSVFVVGHGVVEG